MFLFVQIKSSEKIDSVKKYPSNLFSKTDIVKSILHLYLVLNINQNQR